MDPCNDKMDYDLSDTETQLPDDPQSPGGEVENQTYDHVELRNIHDAVAIDDINECGDAFETQLLDAYENLPVMDFWNETELVADEDMPGMNVLNETELVGDEDIPLVDIGNETQVVADEDMPVTDIGNETQVVRDDIHDANLFNDTQLVDLAGETQRVEELDCDANMGTQILDDNDVAVNDGDDSDRTEVVYDTEEASDDDSMKNRDIHTSSNAEKAPHKEDEASTAGERQSGSSFSDFTTIRVASTIASGLAAQRMARERLKGKSVSAASDRSSMRQLAAQHACIAGVRNSPNAVKEASQITDQDGKSEQMKELTNESRFNICSSTVRKLFPENTTPETVQPDGGMNESSDGDFPEFENGMSGLSYVNSQEPGELSQANALEFVDNLLKFDIIENDKDVEITKSNLGNHKVISSLEGVRRLAATPGTPFENKATFDWDDNREDECGGEFFRKKKDLFFDNGIQKFKSLTRPRKPSLDSRKGKAIETCGGQRADHLVVNKNSRKPPKSDSRIGLRKSKGSGNSSKLVENLSKNLNKQFAASDDKVLETNTRKNETYLLDVGPDTQIAAEAMETLGIAMPGNDFRVEKTPKEMTKDCQEVGAHNKLPIGQRDKLLGDARVVKRQSRRTRSSVVLSRDDTSPRCENVKTRSELTRSKFSKAKQMVTPKGLSEDDCGNSNNDCSASFEQVKGKRISKRNVDDAAGKEKKEFGLQEHLSSLTPVARRTRQQQKVDQINSAGKDIVHSSKVIKDLAGVAPRKRSRRDTNPTESLLTPVETRDGKSACDDQFDPSSSGSLAPVVLRTRQQLKVDQINSAGKDAVHSSKEIKDLLGVAPRKRSRRDTNPTESLLTPVEARDGKAACDDQFDPSSSGTPGLLKFDAAEHPRGCRTRRKVQLNKGESETGYSTRSGRLRSGSTTAVKGVTNAGSNKDNDPEVRVVVDGAEASVRVDSSPRNGCDPSSLASTTSTICRTPVNDASPICMGDEYDKQSRRKRLSRSPLVKELNSLIMSGAKSVMPDSRRKREITDLRVLFSHHLDADIIRQQKKVLSRLGASEVSSMSDATHFITDQFVRTQNMLEAIALGKPVVTHLWLRSCGQASCVIDEKNFILRDARKEKEIGFSMPVSLARACQHPLLQGQRVLITPNTKPGKEILASLVKAVHGLAIERLGRSAINNEKLPDDILILSCEEDYETCIPFLEKGSAVYSSELLLNGIVIQKLEYDRHRLFLDSVKATRSKIWVKKKRT